MRIHFSRWFEGHYNDAQLALLARRAVAVDAQLADLSRLSITCTRGIICLKGRVSQPQDRTRIEADIHTALQMAGLAYKRIRNQLSVPKAPPRLNNLVSGRRDE